MGDMFGNPEAFCGKSSNPKKGPWVRILRKNKEDKKRIWHFYGQFEFESLPSLPYVEHFDGFLYLECFCYIGCHGQLV
jgi:hypothetical protein